MGEVVSVRGADPVWGHRPGLAPADFPRTGWGHRGYDAGTVDSFVERAGLELSAAQDQIQDLRQEVDRLHRYIRRQWAAVAAAESAHVQGQDASTRFASPAAQARAVLTQAQEVAERRLADAAERLAEADRVSQARLASADRQAAERLAEADDLVTRRVQNAEKVAAERLDRIDTIANDVITDARREAVRQAAQAQADAHRLLAMARTRYEEIVIRAHQRADHAAELALHSYEQAAEQAGRDADAGRARAELEMKAAYLRTFAKVSRTALQAALEISGREFDRLLGASAADEGAAVQPAVIVLPSSQDGMDYIRITPLTGD